MAGGRYESVFAPGADKVFYEFSRGKQVFRYIKPFKPYPWEITVTGLCRQELRLDLDEFYQLYAFFNNTADADRPDEFPTQFLTSPAQEEEIERIADWIVKTAEGDVVAGNRYAFKLTYMGVQLR